VEGGGSLRCLSGRPARQAWSRVPSMDTRGHLRAAGKLHIRALSLERSYSATDGFRRCCEPQSVPAAIWRAGIQNSRLGTARAVCNASQNEACTTLRNGSGVYRYTLMRIFALAETFDSAVLGLRVY
jgi:hypothetical protein